MIEEILIFIFASVFAWLNSFLLHEWSHIKGEGLFNCGKINVNEVGFTATPDETKDARYMRFSGGFYSGCANLAFGAILWAYGIWTLYIPFITVAILNIVYAFWEMDHGGEGRFKIYGITLLAMIIFWLVI